MSNSRPLCRVFTAPGRSAPRRGATMILLLFLLTILLAMVAFAVDVGRMYLARAQLQTAVDAGALAGGLQLRRDTSNVSAAIELAKTFVQLNRVGSYVTVPEDAIQVEVGTWDPDTRTFRTETLAPDAIRVTGSLEHEPFFFGKLLGLSSFAVPRTAVAQGGSPLDLVMTLDLSSSMGSQGRIQALHEAAPLFVQIVEEVGDDDRIAIMGYGALPSNYNPASRGHRGVMYRNAPIFLYPPSSDWCAVLEAGLTSDFPYLRGNVLDRRSLIAAKYGGGTPLGAALRDSVHFLAMNARTGVDRIVVLMSDGRANKPPGTASEYAVEMANYAASLDIRVYTLSLGNEADLDLMQQIADTTAGRHFVAVGTPAELPARLSDAFTNIAKAIKQSHLVQ